MNPSNETGPDERLAFGALQLVRPVGRYRPWILGAIYALLLWPLTEFPRHSGNVLSRYMTIEAIVQQGTFAVERTTMMMVSRPVDMVRFGNHYYSDKPPVLQVIAAPIYGALFLMGYPITIKLEHFVFINQTITWIIVGLCSAMTLVWLRRIFQAFAIRPSVADALTLAFGFGSQLFTYAVTFNNHSVAAALITGAMTKVLLERPRDGVAINRMGVGLLVGFAAVIDLPSGCLMTAGLGLILAIRARSIPWAFLLGAIIPLLLHSWLQSRITGSPLPAEMYPESFHYPNSFWDKPDGIFHEYGPRAWFALELLIGPPGWLTLTPVLAIGLVVLVGSLVRRDDPLRPMAAVVLGTLMVLIVYYTWLVRRTDFAGESFGTRHLLAITPAVYVFTVAAFGRIKGRSMVALFVVLMGVGFFYAFQGMMNPWSRIEEREQRNPSIRFAQRFVLYPWSRTRHKFEMDRLKEENPTRTRP